MKRLTRPDNPHHPFSIQPRDIECIRFVARVGSATSEQITRAVGGSPKGVSTRLKLLFFHAYLDRPKQQRTHLSGFFDTGNGPLIYSLGRAGARLLAELGDDINDHLSWSAKNARATAPFLAHRIEVAEAVLNFLLSCRADGAPRFVDHHALLPSFPDATRDAADPFRLRVTIPAHGHDRALSIPIVPDRLFSLVYENARHNYAMELDRGSMPVKSKSLAGRSNYRKKLASYFHAHLQGCHRTQWNFQGMRVLTLAPSEARIAHMIDAQREVTNERLAGLFLYSTLERMTQHGALGPIWMTSERDGISLQERS